MQDETKTGAANNTAVNDRLLHALARQQSNIEVILACTPQGIALYNADHTLAMCNRRYMSIYGLRAEIAAPGTPFDEIQRYRADAGVFSRESCADAMERLQEIRHGRRIAPEILTLSDGRKISITCHPLEDGGWLSTHDDVTEIWALQREIEHMAYHDQLTGLANRRLMMDRLTEAMDARRRVALLMLDLDGFKGVNDRYGHPVGDALLQSVSNRLKECAGEGDLVSRLGGDEFAIIHFGMRDPEHSRQLSNRIVEHVARPHSLPEATVHVGVSIGLAFIDSTVDTVDDLFRRADEAMYDSKRAGKGRVTLYEAA